jgi:glutaminyl-tRNA synthetase
MNTQDKETGTDFIREIVAADIRSNRHDGRVITRFPPEPNGYLHIGHAKSVVLNFGVATENGGRCHLRFDDTNPTKEDVEYTEAIMEDVRWLGYDWGEHLHYASDYFGRLYEFAVRLIMKGKAYVCDLSADEIRRYRGTLKQPGKNSPYRDRSIEENQDLFERMQAGEFADGSRTLRAKIDMASPNLSMRDPTIYRIRKVPHHRTDDKWCIYPMYDFTHCLSDAIEGITHSLCTLEFENNRPLYDWFVKEVDPPWHPHQFEFARLNLSFTVMSKRKLLDLVEQGLVDGWDDPRIPTLTGMRRRGYTPEAIRSFCERIGVARKDSLVDVALLEHAIRYDLNQKVKRVMCVLRPLKVVIENYPEGQTEELEAPYFPDDPPRMGTRKVPFSREIYIEREDFMEEPYKKFFRLAPGREVRLRWAYIIKCESVIRDEKTGEITEVRCTYDPDTKSGGPAADRKVRGTLHWVSAPHCIEVEARLYDRLFTVQNPLGRQEDFKSFLNPDSLETLAAAKIEPSMKNAQPGDRVQFERQGYFYVDPKDSTGQKIVFNRIVPLRDRWAKLVKAGRA